MTALFTIRNTALLIALGALATIGGAWFIEIVLGVKPCPLCLEQRIPYYAGIPVALLSAALADRAPDRLLAGEVASPEAPSLDIIRRELRLAAELGQELPHPGVEMKQIRLIGTAVGLRQLFPT